MNDEDRVILFVPCNVPSCAAAAELDYTRHGLEVILNNCANSHVREIMWL